MTNTIQNNTSSEITFKKISTLLNEALIKDRVRLIGKAKKVFPRPNEKKPIDEEKAFELFEECVSANEKYQERLSHIPEVSYPDGLPVSLKHEELAKAIKENQVIIVAGDTGSGKTTQLPKICLEAGFGKKGMIGHTQPRRLATRTVASRICEELKCELGKEVGFKVRFSDQTDPNTIIKLMTDGVLLTELERDRYLNDYEVLIIDEAHERSLNIDFILGILHELIKKRKDLKVIITSATIDLERFSKHFNNAPILIVEGRTYPVEVRYRPIGEEEEFEKDDQEEVDLDESDILKGISNAIDELLNEPLGDILIFLNGERDISETLDYLKKCNLHNTEILPLYARLSNAEQNKIFAPHNGRRIVLATNVAETSITVPGIKYVIDLGTARISRYSPRTKVQRLPIEPISQASANQRKGRCGRVSDGICIRLYSEMDFNSRPEFTDPEILRTNLAAVILKMLSLRLGNMEDFPFIEKPEQKQINDGIKLLEELGAIVHNGKELKLTKIGTLMSKLPCDVRLSRMLIEANNEHSLAEILIIVSNLSSQEVRLTPLNHRAHASELHARFNDEKSDFIAILNLYNYLNKLREENSISQMRKIMTKEYLSYIKLREWQDIYSQLKEALVDLKFKFNEMPATYSEIHRPILCGLLSHLGMKKQDSYEYQGSRGNSFYIFPTSSIIKKTPKWIMAAEITQTTKLFARNCAQIEPEWVEKYAKDLIRYSYSDEHWSKNNGAVIASEKGVLYGLSVINGRKVNYSKINPSLCRELFIKEGLVYGEFKTNDKFFKHNLDLVREVEQLEDKSRRRDLLVNDETLIHFYDDRIPEDIVDGQSFEAWWRVKSKEEPNFLNFDLDLISNDSSHVSLDKYPNHLQVGNYRFNLTYNFDPTAENDGVSVHIPISMLNQVDKDMFLWLIPGLRLELFTSLIKVLPKALRKCFVPAPNYGEVLFESLSPNDGYFWDALTQKMTKLSGQKITIDDFNLNELPKHLSFYYVIKDIKNKVLMQGRDLDFIRHKLKDQVKSSLEEVVKEMPKIEGIKTWEFENIPKTQSRVLRGMEIIAYPALKDAGDSVNLELFDSEDEAQRQMWQGQKKLIMLSIPNPLSYLEKQLPNKAKLAMYFNFVGNIKLLIDDLESLAIDTIMEENGGVAWDKEGFEKLVTISKESIFDRVLELAKKCEGILSKANEVRKKLKGKLDLRTAYAYSDMGGQLNHLIYKGFATASKAKYFPNLERYLDAMLKRIEKVPLDPNRDLMMLKKVQDCEENYESLLGLFAGKTVPNDVWEVRFMLEELRVSYFAQSFRTLYPVSDKRVNNEIERLRGIYRK